MTSPIIQIRGVSKSYRRDSMAIPVLRAITLDVPEGEFIALMGPSGSGKTTLLNLIAGIDRPNAGSVRWAEPIRAPGESDLAKWRARHIGFIFQFYNLLPVLTAFENVELPLLLTKLSKQERKQHVEARAARWWGSPTACDHYPRQLSGGQEQRVAIARAIVTDPTHPRGRRAHRRPRPAVGRRVLDAARAAQSGVQQDDRHGDARPARRRTSACDPTPRQGRATVGGAAVSIFKIVLRNAFRHRLRTALTILGIATAVMAFGLIRTVVTAVTPASKRRRPIA